jgi:ABC-2 type transport system permease protein
MVVIFAGRMGSFAATGLVFPAAAAYSILGVSALAYNVLGLDASGVQFYFLSPVPIRTVFLAKNLFGFAITATQLILLYLILVYTSGRPPLLIALTTLCWVLFAAMVNVTVGNMRSITTPKKIDPSKISRKQASQLSALLSLGLMLVVAGIGAGLIFLARAYELPWVPIPTLLALAIGAFVFYWVGLKHMDTLAAKHRETLIEELSKTA